MPIDLNNMTRICRVGRRPQPGSLREVIDLPCMFARLRSASRHSGQQRIELIEIRGAVRVRDGRDIKISCRLCTSTVEWHSCSDWPCRKPQSSTAGVRPGYLAVILVRSRTFAFAPANPLTITRRSYAVPESTTCWCSVNICAYLYGRAFRIC